MNSRLPLDAISGMLASMFTRIAPSSATALVVDSVARAMRMAMMMMQMMHRQPGH